jgi:transposase
MKYHFGPNKPNFTGTDDEWEKLKQVITYWKEDKTNYPSVTVICPHCGAKNTHTDNGTVSHRTCDLKKNKKGDILLYDCPGYYICKYENNPK